MGAYSLMKVAVVGHGRSPEGKGFGSLIDSYDYVIRMWDWGWQDRKDYGEKYDFGLLEAHSSYMRDFSNHNKHTPSVGWIASLVYNSPGKANSAMRNCSLPPDTELFDQEPWVKVGQRMGGAGMTGRLKFTRGTLAALWAMERVAPDELVLVGFDSVYLGHAQPTDEAFSKAYQASPGTFSFVHYNRTVMLDGSTTKHGNHDYAVERPVLEKLAVENGVKLVFSQDVWVT